MATRKRKTLSAVERWEQELPPTLRDYARLVRRQLAILEKQVERARTDVRRTAMRIMRDASYRLGQLEERGEGAWNRLTAPYRREAVRVIRLLENAVAPVPQKARRSRRKTTKKKATKRKATKKRATTRRATTKKTTKRKTTKRKATKKKVVKRASKRGTKKAAKRSAKKRKATRR
jgi:hypothetical protein